MKPDNMRDKIYYFKTEWEQPKLTIGPLAEHTGLSPVITGSKIGIYGRDEALLKNGLSPLNMGYEQKIDRQNLRSTIDDLLNATESTTDLIRLKTPNVVPPKEVLRTPGLGSFGNLISLLTRVYLEPHRDAAADCGEQALTILLSIIPKIEFAAPISANVLLQESIFSFTKIALLVEKLGLEEAKARYEKTNVMAGLKQASLRIPDYVDTLTRFYPVAFSFPFKRDGCSWHFYSKNLFFLPYDLTTSFSDQFTSSSTIRGSTSNAIGLHGFRLPKKNGSWRILKESVNAVNKILAFANNFTNFVDLDDSIDLMRQNKFEISIHFLFADLQAIVNTVSSHSRFAFTLNFFDRLANLYRGYTGDKTNSEVAISQIIISQPFGENLAKMLSENYSIADSEFGAEISHLTSITYENINSTLANDLGDESTEKEKGDYIRLLRNLTHGGFLDTKRNNQYDEFLLKSKMELPEDLVTLPWLIMFGLCANPIQFFSLLKNE